MKSRDWTPKLVGGSLSVLQKVMFCALVLCFFQGEKWGDLPWLPMLKASTVPVSAALLCTRTMLRGGVKALLG